jgi:general stress protein 26
MKTSLTRRNMLDVSTAVGLSAVVAGCSTSRISEAALGNLYRIDDEAKIIAAAKSVIDEDYIATLITIDAEGVPRARSIGVWAPENGLVLWMGTRRASRKVEQIRHNPNATIHFARDDISGDFQDAYYASFMGTATVHTDDATVQERAPEEAYRRSQWPNFPHDYAAIRFETRWLEVFGRGIKSKPETWQPQAVTLAT